MADSRAGGGPADELDTSIGGRLALRRDDAAVAVLGAGQDDLVPGRRYLEALAEGGWATPTWPREHGGRGATAAEVSEIARGLARYEQPDLYPYLVGLHVAGPTILAVADDAQRARWLPPIRTGADIWCQLFSEPGAGSDLANVSTTAVRDGDEWRVTGQKVWTSRGHYADWGLLLARTDPEATKHAGITAFAVRMDAPGVDVRPLRQMNGDAHFSEVFLDDVVVPDTDRIGAVGEGWPVARTALANERGAIAATNTGMGAPMHRLLELSARRCADAGAERRGARGVRGERGGAPHRAPRPRRCPLRSSTGPGRVGDEAPRERDAQVGGRPRARGSWARTPSPRLQPTAGRLLTPRSPNGRRSS